MSENKSIKKAVWQSIYRLVKPYRKKLGVIFFISLMATGVTLLEPLIYREAINDVTGIFVQKAKDDARAEAGLETGTDKDPIISFLEKEVDQQETPETSAGQAATADPKKEKHKKEPHSKTHVAPRTPSQAFNTLMWAVALLFLINFLGLIFWWLGENMNVKLSCNIERKFIKGTFSHVLRLPLAFFTKRSSGALHQQIDQSEAISGTVTYFTKDVFPEIVSLVGILAIMFWQNYVLTLLALSIVPVYLFITIRSTRKLESSLSSYYDKWEGVSARMLDALGGIKTVKLSGAEEREVNRLDEEIGSAYNDYTKRSFMANKYSFWQVLLTHVASAMVLSYGGYLALHHRLTPGDVVMFVTYLDMLYEPIDNLSEIWSDVQQNATSIGRAFKLLDVKAEEKKGHELQLKKGKVEFKNVRFGYDPNREILRGLSFIAKPGQVTALVGTSGAGKTTTVDLLMKLFEPKEGAVYIDGQNLAEMDDASVRRSIGMVAADGAIFRGTLADNIRYKRPEASDKEVEAAAVAAGMQGTLQRLPEGLNTVVGESGFGLSVGERQRIQIARVIVDKPKILVMDEATANLDYETEAEVKRTIDEISRHNTVIIIAHRFSMVKDADHVVVLDAGEVIEEGTPEALIGNGGWFADFANAGEEEGEEEVDEEDGGEGDLDEEDEDA